jgi:DNA repair protein RadC
MPRFYTTANSWPPQRAQVLISMPNSAAALVLYHNHPSGQASPSQADELITARVREGLALIDVRVLDHILGGL